MLARLPAWPRIEIFPNLRRFQRWKAKVDDNREVGKCKDETSTNLVNGTGGDEKTTESTGRTSRQFPANGVDTTLAAKTNYVEYDGQELKIGQRILHEMSIFKGWKASNWFGRKSRQLH